MAKIKCKILNQNKFTELTGKRPREDVVEIEKKEAKLLIKKGVVELSALQKLLQQPKTEKIVIDKNPELITLLKQPDLYGIIIREIQKNVVGEKNSIKSILTNCMLSKVKNKRGSSTNLCMNATSGTGKDYTVSAVMKFFPKQLVYKKRRITQKVLDYSLSRNQHVNWNHRILYLEDVSKKVLNSSTVKTLLSADPNETSEVDTVVDGEAVTLKIQGKPVFLFTSAKAEGKDETLRRVPFCFMDETPEQTLKISFFAAKEDETGTQQQHDEKIKNFYNGLIPVRVVVPFGIQIVKGLSEKWIKQAKQCQIMQRTIFPRFQDYIKASACLHQHQRKKDKKGNIIACPLDYDHARDVLLQTTSNVLMVPLGKEQKEVIEAIEEHFPEGGSVKEISIKYPKGEDRWLRYTLDRLVQLGFLDLEKHDVDGADKFVGLYSVVDGVLDFNIPTWSELQQLNGKNIINSFTAIGAKGSKRANSAKRAISKKKKTKKRKVKK